jgi:hypothetical protein
MRNVIVSITRTVGAILIVGLMVAIYLIVLTRGGHLHWVLP